MKALVIYDSTFGNTKTIAETICSKLGKDAQPVYVKDLTKEHLKGIDLLVVGSPIIAWKPSENMGKFLAGLKPNQLNGYKAAAFDTRVKLFISGDGAKKIAKSLMKAGAELVIEPQGFFVNDKEGPLLKGETERAAEWVEKIKQQAKS